MASFFSLYAPPLTTGDEKALLHLRLQLERGDPLIVYVKMISPPAAFS